MTGGSVVIGGRKFLRRGEATKTSSGYMVTFSWKGVKRRASKSSCAMRGEVGGIVQLEGLLCGQDPLFIALVARVSFGACLDDCHRSLRLDLEQTSPTPRPKSPLKGGSPSIIREIVSFGVVRGSEI